MQLKFIAINSFVHKFGIFKKLLHTSRELVKTRFRKQNTGTFNVVVVYPTPSNGWGHGGTP